VSARELFGRLWARRRVRVALIVAAAALPVLGGGAAWGFHFIRTDPRFCMSCHLMAEPAERWGRSVHKDLACQKCHRADIFEEARLGYAAFIERRREIGPHSRLPASICRECHMSDDPRYKQVSDTAGHRTHVLARGSGCLECHATRVHEFKADVASCARCHGAEKVRIAKMETLHCLGCHDFLAATPKPMPDAAKCRTCHPADPAAALAPRDPAHAGRAVPVGKGHDDCLGCHRPHGAALEDPVDCLRCHKALLDPKSAHYKDERLETCTDCHVPHKP
jgi:nitrate/TMAO reductase-like tetraheme cytochrome c subunit